jgi:hypothetical protein
MTVSRPLGNNAKDVMGSIEDFLAANNDDLLDLIVELAAMTESRKAVNLVRNIAARNSRALRATTLARTDELRAAQDVFIDFHIRQKERGA